MSHRNFSSIPEVDHVLGTSPLFPLKIFTRRELETHRTLNIPNEEGKRRGRE